MYKHPVLRPPTTSQVEEVAKDLHLDLEDDEIQQFKDCMAGALQQLCTIFDFPDQHLPVKYPRTGGHRPPPEENSHNAWAFKADVQGAPEGKLKGKRVILKDTIPLAGVPMRDGSNVLEGFVPDIDATVVTKVLDAGGHIVGKGAVENLCLSGSSFTSHYGPILNPYDKTRSAGGSTHGCAVLINLGEADMGIGADQGGSIRLPCCWSGIVGMKPTFGLIPYTGIIQMEGSLDCAGPMAKNVTDCALLLEVLACYDDGRDPRQPVDLESKIVKYTDYLTGDLKGMKVGILTEGFDDTETDVAEIVRNAAHRLAERGAVVEEVSVSMHRYGHPIWQGIAVEGMYMTMHQMAGCTLGYDTFQPTGDIEALARGLRTSINDTSYSFKYICMTGAYLQKHYKSKVYAHACNLRRPLTEAYEKALKDYDVLIMPTIRYKPPKLPPADMTVKEFAGNALGHVKNTAPFNLTGHPAVNVPAGFSEGLPVGMMIVGRRWEDATTLKVAHAYEQLREEKK